MTDTEIIVIKATIKSDNSRELKDAVLSYKSWRLAELCESTYGMVAPTQGVYLEIDAHDASQEVGCESGDFIILLTKDTVNGGLEALLACDDIYVLAVLDQKSDFFDLAGSLVEHKINQKDDESLDAIYRALHDAA